MTSVFVALPSSSSLHEMGPRSPSTLDRMADRRVEQCDGRKKRSMCEETIREQLEQTPAKRRRRWLQDRIRDVQQKQQQQTAAPVDTVLQSMDAPSHPQDGRETGARRDTDYLEENELLQLYYAMERELMEEELEYLASREQEDIDALLMQQVEEYEESERTCCPFCHEGTLIEERGSSSISCQLCGVTIPETSLAVFCDKMRDAVALHAEFCPLPLRMEQLNDTDIVLATCDVCETRLSIV